MKNDKGELNRKKIGTILQLFKTYIWNTDTIREYGSRMTQDVVDTSNNNLPLTQNNIDRLSEEELKDFDVKYDKIAKILCNIFIPGSQELDYREIAKLLCSIRDKQGIVDHIIIAKILLSMKKSNVAGQTSDIDNNKIVKILCNMDREKAEDILDILNKF